jgi:hypothetical protein
MNADDKESTDDDAPTTSTEETENDVVVKKQYSKKKVKNLIREDGRVVTLDEIKQNKTLQLGMSFANYEQFQNAFYSYKLETLQIFTKQSSLFNHEENDSGKPYKMIIFSCVRSGLNFKTKGCSR